jgi:hypothetical protein
LQQPPSPIGTSTIESLQSFPIEVFCRFAGNRLCEGRLCAYNEQPSNQSTGEEPE